MKFVLLHDKQNVEKENRLKRLKAYFKAQVTVNGICWSFVGESDMEYIEAAVRDRLIKLREIVQQLE